MLEVEHADPDLARVETEANFSGGFSPPVVNKFRYVMQLVRMVRAKNGLHQFGGLRLEKLSGKRQHQYSMRLNKKYRLIVAFSGQEPEEKVRIVAIENHYGD